MCPGKMSGRRAAGWLAALLLLFAAGCGGEGVPAESPAPAQSEAPVENTPAEETPTPSPTATPYVSTVTPPPYFPYENDLDAYQLSGCPALYASYWALIEAMGQPMYDSMYVRDNDEGIPDEYYYVFDYRDAIVTLYYLDEHETLEPCVERARVEQIQVFGGDYATPAGTTVGQSAEALMEAYGFAEPKPASEASHSPIGAYLHQQWADKFSEYDAFCGLMTHIEAHKPRTERHNICFLLREGEVACILLFNPTPNGLRPDMF